MMQTAILICGLIAVADLPAPNPVVPPFVPAKQPSVEVWDGYYTAELNTHYHQGFAAEYRTLDTWSRFAAILLGVASLVAPFMLGFKSKLMRRVSTSVGFASLIAALVLTFWNFGNLYETHATLAIRWCELAHDWNALRDERGKIPEGELLARVHALRAKQMAIETSEPPQPDEKYLKECQAKLNHRLGIATPDNSAPRSSSLDTNTRR